MTDMWRPGPDSMSLAAILQSCERRDDRAQAVVESAAELRADSSVVQSHSVRSNDVHGTPC